MAKKEPTQNSNENEAPAPTEGKNVVQMTDGREIDFGVRAKVKKDILNDEAGNPIGVRFDVANGETRTLMLSEVQACLNQLACHGIAQKVGDEYSGMKDASIDDYVLVIDKSMANLREGKFYAERQSNEMAGTSILLRALVQHYGQSVEEVKAVLETLTGKEKAALRASAELAPVIQALEAEKVAKSSVDTGALLQRFGTSA